MVLWIDRLLSDLRIADMAAKRVLDLVQASLDVRCCALQECLDRTIGQIPDKAGQVIAGRRSLRCIAKTNPLYPPLEYDISRRLAPVTILFE